MPSPVLSKTLRSGTGHEETQEQITEVPCVKHMAGDWDALLLTDSVTMGK